MNQETIGNAGDAPHQSQHSHFERALFILGDRDSGKSSQLRSMLLDWRLGYTGNIPTANRIREAYPLSNERWLHIRLSSPHESGQRTIEDFLRRCENVMKRKIAARRWNFAGALQIRKTKYISVGPEEVVKHFKIKFNPERVRIVILSPDCNKIVMDPIQLNNLTSSLRLIGCEVCVVDATDQRANALIYADFFDFT